MAGTVEQKLAEQGIKLHDAPTPVANYVPFVRTGNLLFVSGQVCFDPAGKLIAKGKLGAGVSIEEGAARQRAAVPSTCSHRSRRRLATSTRLCAWCASAASSTRHRISWTGRRFSTAPPT
ncbi:hypothetical protein ACVWYH_008393 [Bradyrhizobium sp. GM24.11]